MTYTAKALVAPQLLPTAATKLYTSPAAISGGKGTWIDSAAGSNVTAGAATVTAYIVPSGGATNDNTKVLPPLSVAAGAAAPLSAMAGRFMSPGDELWMQSSVASAINVAIAGREIT